MSFNYIIMEILTSITITLLCLYSIWTLFFFFVIYIEINYIIYTYIIKFNLHIINLIYIFIDSISNYYIKCIVNILLHYIILLYYLLIFMFFGITTIIFLIFFDTTSNGVKSFEIASKIFLYVTFIFFLSKIEFFLYINMVWFFRYMPFYLKSKHNFADTLVLFYK